MTDAWYYGDPECKMGPFSGRELKEFAVCGLLLPTDTVWKAGVEKGALARRVKGLFSPAHAAPPVASSAPLAEVPPSGRPRTPLPPRDAKRIPVEGATDKRPKESPPGEVAAYGDLDAVVLVGDVEPDFQGKAPESPRQQGAQPHQVKKARVIAVKGAVMVGQDGANVQYRKKCTACGHEDPCWNTMPIRNGSAVVGFFCPKCRKVRWVEIQGVLN